MIMAGVDMKSALNPPQESVLDRVMKVVENALPMVVMLASQAKQGANQTIPLQMAQSFVKNDQDFQAVIRDPQLRDAAIERMDTEFGWEQTDYILKIAGVSRSVPNTDPSMRYPEGDERNEPVETENLAE